MPDSRGLLPRVEALATDCTFVEEISWRRRAGRGQRRPTRSFLSYGCESQARWQGILVLARFAAGGRGREGRGANSPGSRPTVGAQPLAGAGLHTRRRRLDPRAARAGGTRGGIFLYGGGGATGGEEWGGGCRLAGPGSGSGGSARLRGHQDEDDWV
ncbi:keratin, type II cytoskeletal 2 epidermal isoform X3 [Triticum aestivum]|uniref:keratin, type II cytoskeletal 2 epidermal isoform X3 n=1 Tax=Triticum aestivum TaxID=4565 RepID=UPI001D022D77|nr:keratin, type II cytoskeletal 2 epidermal-like isoform X3 [Triticum aestivum]